MFKQTLLGLVAGAMLLASSGCYVASTHYDMGLAEVERPAKAKQRFGEQKIVRGEEGGVQKYFFEDEMVKIAWVPGTEGISFALHNKTKHSIKLLWNEAVFIDPQGTSHRVMHNGVKFNDRNGDQPATVIPRLGNISDNIVSVDQVRLAGEAGWITDDFLPTPIAFSEVQAEEFAAQVTPYIGKTFQVLLPLQIEDVTNEYIFSFKILDAHIRPKVKAQRAQ
jgi:hypothetical protein